MLNSTRFSVNDNINLFYSITKISEYPVFQVPSNYKIERFLVTEQLISI